MKATLINPPNAASPSGSYLGPHPFFESVQQDRL